RCRATGAGGDHARDRRHGSRSAGPTESAVDGTDRPALPRCRIASASAAGRLFRHRCRRPTRLPMSTELNQRQRATLNAQDGQGPRVAIVSPSGYAPDPAAVTRGIATLEAQGCRVRNLTDPGLRFHRFGASDDQRIAQLLAAASDPEIDIVLALRGGYGLTRLLPDLDLGLLARSGKLFVGHSDFTALQMALLAQEGCVTFSVPMLYDEFIRTSLSVFTLTIIWLCLTTR